MARLLIGDLDKNRIKKIKHLISKTIKNQTEKKHFITENELAASVRNNISDLHMLDEFIVKDYIEDKYKHIFNYPAPFTIIKLKNKINLHNYELNTPILLALIGPGSYLYTLDSETVKNALLSGNTTYYRCFRADSTIGHIVPMATNYNTDVSKQPKEAFEIVEDENEINKFVDAFVDNTIINNPTNLIRILSIITIHNLK